MLSENLIFSNSPNDDLAAFLNSRKYSKVVALVDDQTRTFCMPLFDSKIFHEIIEVASGEEHKNLRTCEYIWSEMTRYSLDRHAVMVVVGGGVLGDMGGFCAATYKRGIDFILTPTTLLAQVDSSIGGKLGIDFQNFKNHIGVFQRPVLNLIHSGFLKTLPREELRSGFAEVIKHCLISDPVMWNEIKSRGLDDQSWEVLAKHSADFKMKITAEDPTEKGKRKILNAGHTIGHALESYLLNTDNRILHGEAVAIGLVAEAYLSLHRGLLSESDLRDISSTIIRIYGKIKLTDEQIEGASGLAIQDKKNRENRIMCVLLNGIGNAKWDCEIEVSQIKDALHFYANL